MKVDRFRVLKRSYKLVSCLTSNVFVDAWQSLPIIKEGKVTFKGHNLVETTTSLALKKKPTNSRKAFSVQLLICILRKEWLTKKNHWINLNE